MFKPQLEKCSFEFSQEGNTCGSASDIEILHVTCESSLGIDHDIGGYYVLKTEGWSIESVSELQELFDRISKIIKKEE